MDAQKAKSPNPEVEEADRHGPRDDAPSDRVIEPESHDESEDAKAKEQHGRCEQVSAKRVGFGLHRLKRNRVLQLERRLDPPTTLNVRRPQEPLGLRAIADESPPDWASGLGNRPTGESHSHVRPIAEVRIESDEHSDTIILVVLLDLDVMKSVNHAMEELDPQRLIVRPDVDPVPRDRPRITPRTVGSRGIPAGRPLQECFGLIFRDSPHTAIIDHLPA